MGERPPPLNKGWDMQCDAYSIGRRPAVMFRQIFMCGDKTNHPPLRNATATTSLQIPHHNEASNLPEFKGSALPKRAHPGWQCRDC